MGRCVSGEGFSVGRLGFGAKFCDSGGGVVWGSGYKFGLGWDGERGWLGSRFGFVGVGGNVRS